MNMKRKNSTAKLTSLFNNHNHHHPGDVGVTSLKLSVIGVCLMGDPVGIGRAHDCPILTVETEHLSNIMDKDEKTATPEAEKMYEKYIIELEVLQKSLNIHDIYKSPFPSSSMWNSRILQRQSQI